MDIEWLQIRYCINIGGLNAYALNPQGKKTREDFCMLGNAPIRIIANATISVVLFRQNILEIGNCSSLARYV